MRKIISFLLILTFFVSCGGVRKAKQSTKTAIDSTAFLQQKKVEKKDSAHNRTKKNIAKISDSVGSESSVNVEFYNDTSVRNKPIIIIERGDTTIIDAGGRGLKSVSKKRNVAHKGTNTKMVIDENSTRLKDSATATITEQATVAKTKQERTKNKEVKPLFLARIGVYALLAVGALLALVVVKYWAKIVGWWRKVF